MAYLQSKTSIRFENMSSFSEDLVVDTAENEPRKGFKKGPLKSLPSVKGFRLRREVENVDPADDARVQGAYRRGQLHGGGEVLVAFYSTQGRVQARQERRGRVEYCIVRSQVKIR